MLILFLSEIVLVLAVLVVVLWLRRPGREAAALRLAADHAADMLSWHAPGSLKFQYVSAACAALGDYTSTELLGRSLLDFAHPHDWRALEEADGKESLFWRLLRKDGGWIWVESSVRHVPQAKGPGSLLWVTRDASAHMRAEAALREVEKRYRMIAERISDVVWVLDVEKKCYTFVSPSVQRLLGQDANALVGRSPAVWMTPECWVDFTTRLSERLGRYEEAGDEDEPVAAEFPAVRPNGSNIWLECRSTLGRSATGRLEITGVLRDVTVRHEMEESLRKSERELQVNNHIFMALLDAVQTRVFWKDRAGHYLGCNQAFAEDAGFSSIQEVLGKTDAEIGWNGRAQKMAERDRPVLEQGLVESGNIAEQILHDGSVCYVLSHRAPLRDEKGSINGVLGTYSDITSLVVAERTLRDSERRYRHMVDHQADFIVKMDLDGKFIYASPSYCDLVDAPLDELLGHYFLPPPDSVDHQAVEEALQRIQEAPHQASFEQRVNSGNRWRWIAWNVSGVPDEDNRRVRQLVGAGRDITEQKSLMEEREKLLRQMESKNVELERIANLVTHDVKSALFNMAGFAQELKHDLGAGYHTEAHEDAEQIIRAGDRLGQLLEAEIRLSRIALDFSGHWFDAGRLVGSVLRERKHEFETLRLEVLLQTSVQQAWGDERKVATALRCLLDNAIKFRSGRAQQSLLVTLERNCGPSGCYEVCVGVYDNGIGVQPLFLPQMFELFNKQDATTPGLGEGLATVRRIAEIHGGRCWATSDGLGQGAFVCFTLPEPDAPPSTPGT
jgi:PAS domain S-box-containing protein